MVLKFEADFDSIGKYGQIATPYFVKDFNDVGIEYQDFVKVTFLDKSIIVPFVPSYRYVRAGGTVFMGENDHKIDLMSFHSNFCRKNHIAVFIEDETNTTEILPSKSVKYPVSFTIELYAKKGYADIFKFYDLKRTNNREDYNELTDEEYCNFRCVVGGVLKENLLYRSSSPINPFINRNKYADDIINKYNIKSIINLCDDLNAAKKFPGYDDTYYSKQNILFLNTNADIASYNFGKNLVKTIRFINENEGPYLIHCMEGQDRTGAMCAIIASIFSASKNELINDYMKTYENFYKVVKNSEQYIHIYKGTLQDDIMSVRGFTYDTLDVLKNPESYLLFLDLTPKDLETFKKKLGR